MSDNSQAMRSLRPDSTRLKGVRDPVRLRRRLNRFKNKHRERSKAGDERLAQEPPPAERQKPEPGPDAEQLSSEDVNVNDPFPNEESSEDLPDGLMELPSSEDEELEADLPDENLFSHTGQPTVAPPVGGTTKPPVAPSPPTVAPAKPSEPFSPTAPIDGQPTAPSSPSSDDRPTRPSSPTVPTGPSSPTVPTGVSPTVPTDVSPDEPATSPSVPTGGAPITGPAAMPSFPTDDDPPIGPPSPTAREPNGPSPTVLTEGPPSSPSPPTVHTDDTPGAPSSPSALTDGSPDATSSPTVPTVAAPSPTVPVDDPPSGADAPSAPSMDSPDSPDAGPTVPAAAPSADPPEDERPPSVDVPDERPPSVDLPDDRPPSVDINPPSAPTSALTDAPDGPEAPSLSLLPPSAEVPTSPTSPIAVPGAPTKPKKPTLPPVYFNPLPTPRPTKHRPSAPPPKPTRKPSKLSPRPTVLPTISPRPSITPKASSTTAPTTPTKMPAKMPAIVSMPVITTSPTIFGTEAPTFKPLPTKETTTKESPRPTVSADELMLTKSPTFRPSTTIPDEVLPAPEPTAPPMDVPPTLARPTIVIIPFDPSGAPTPLPTVEPSSPPTESPTQSPSTLPSMPPPTASPSSPTASPSSPTQEPTEASAEPTTPPSTQPTPFDPSTCESDEDGNYGFPTAPVEQVIEYQYQVEATSQVTEDDLNNVILLEMEKDISDVLVPDLFFDNGECDDVVAQSSRTSEGLVLKDIEREATSDKRKAQKWAMNILAQREEAQHKKPRGDRTDGWDTTPSGHRGLKGVRQLQNTDELVGLTASPPDFVIRDSLGRLQNACPFPVTGTGPDGQPLVCWVIQGRLTVYGFGDLSWVEPVVQDSLNRAMEDGEFDNGAVNPNVIYVRHIPPGTELNVTTDGVRGGDDETTSDGPPVWAWVLIGLGIFGVLLSVIYFFLKRKEQQDEFERQKAETEFFTGENDGVGGEGEGGEDDQNENAALVAAAGGAGLGEEYEDEDDEGKDGDEAYDEDSKEEEKDEAGLDRAGTDSADDGGFSDDGGGDGELDSANNSGQNSAPDTPSRQSVRSRQSASSQASTLV